LDVKCAVGDQIEFVQSEALGQNALALIDAEGAVWYTFARPWWDIASWLWWFLTPGEKKWVFVRKVGNTKVRIQAVKLTKTHVKVHKAG
jgi:hypothetical protein